MISLYSAYYSKNKISIIAILPKDSIKTKLLCDLSVDYSNLQTEVFIETLCESYAKYYSYISVKIICPKLQLINSSKVKVLFKINENFLETSFIPIIAIEKNETVFKTKDKNQESIQEIVVCVRPLFGPFSSLSSILEFIAYYRANGIHRIIFYDLSITSTIKSLLESMSFVQLLPFDLPIDSNDIHAEGQIAAINDCLLRSSPNTVILVDIDELIVTKTYSDLKTFVNFKLKNESVGALVIPNVMHQYHINTNVDKFPKILYSIVRQTT
jgi:hypothetical protein